MRGSFTNAIVAAGTICRLCHTNTTDQWRDRKNPDGMLCGKCYLQSPFYEEKKCRFASTTTSTVWLDLTNDASVSCRRYYHDQLEAQDVAFKRTKCRNCTKRHPLKWHDKTNEKDGWLCDSCLKTNRSRVTTHPSRYIVESTTRPSQITGATRVTGPAGSVRNATRHRTRMGTRSVAVWCY